MILGRSSKLPCFLFWLSKPNFNRPPSADFSKGEYKMQAFTVTNKRGTFAATVWATSAHQACLTAWALGAHPRSTLIAQQINGHGSAK